IDQNVDGQFMFFMEPPGQTPHASRRLTVSCQQDAVVSPPELVFRQAIPLRAFFDQEQEVCGATTDLQILWFHDRGYRIASFAQARTVHPVPVVTKDARPAE